jgi:predicted transcriptional regulator
MPLSAKEEAKRLIDQLPDQAILNDIMYELYVKQKIEAGLIAVEEGRTIPHDQVKARILARHQKPL